MTEDLDREQLLVLVKERNKAAAARDYGYAKYLQGRIDSHCAQNAIPDDAVRDLRLDNVYAQQVERLTDGD